MSITQWENHAEVATVPTGGITRLVDWAQEADAAYQLAHKLTSTAFCPEQFRGKPADAAAAMLAGGELGLSPLTALGAFDVIQGRAAARAITLRALVQSQGHEVILEESTNTRCRMKGRRKGASEWQRVTWTIERAQAMNLTGKSNWKSQPQAMLVARATSELCRLIASDAILGIGGGYAAEELADGGGVEPVDPAPAPTPTRRMSRKPKPAAEDGTPQRDEDGQKAKMFALFGEAAKAGHVEEDRQSRLDFCMATINREITSSNDLTWDERSKVIEALAALVDPWAGAEDAEVVEP